MQWTVGLAGKAEKQLRKLPEYVREAFVALVKEMEDYGPYRNNWAHYGKLRGSGSQYHCHICSGRPTYVVCWEIKEKTIRVVEIYYVGTHENAPY
ncbi:MAG: cytotoxic translational repressor of toxin-antitoxin stability system [Bdellovibrio sp.]|nr:MAG: cytotoxic translational repressor of toxin-antitoxin stability system [Bdellovibrio sp.]